MMWNNFPSKQSVGVKSSEYGICRITFDLNNVHMLNLVFIEDAEEPSIFTIRTH